MSVKVMGPEGRGAVASELFSGTAGFVADTDGTVGVGFANDCAGDSTLGEGFCLQAVIHKSASSNR